MFVSTKYLPALSVIVPTAVPLNDTDAKGTGSPVLGE